MAYCPNCGAVIAKEALQCAKCSASFDDGGWKPLDAPPGGAPARPDLSGIANPAYCPSCGAAIEKDALQCTKCTARFDGEGWKPLDIPPVLPHPDQPSGAEKLAFGIVKFVLVALSLPVLLFGAVVGFSENAHGWGLLGILGMFAAVIVAFAGKARWSFLILFLAIAFTFGSCATNWKWHGG